MTSSSTFNRSKSMTGAKGAPAVQAYRKSFDSEEAAARFRASMLGDGWTCFWFGKGVWDSLWTVVMTRPLSEKKKHGLEARATRMQTFDDLGYAEEWIEEMKDEGWVKSNCRWNGDGYLVVVKKY